MTEEEKQFKYQLLSFAKDILWEDYNIKRQKSDSEFSMWENAWRDRDTRIKDAPVYKVPTLPTAEDIIAMADAFNEYCNCKKYK